MEIKYSIRLTTFSNGERYPLLLNQQGQPHWYATLYATTQIRNASKASNTIVAVLSAIRILISWALSRDQDIESRFSQRRFLNEHELESLRQYTQLIKAKEPSNQKITSMSKRVEDIRGSIRVSEDRISGSTQYIRMTYIADYIEWLAINLIERDAKQIDEESLKAIKKMSFGIRERRPQKITKSRENARKGLTKQQQEVLLNLITPKSEGNPFSAEVQIRNQLIILLLYHLGLRAGELLALRISDFDFQKNTLLVARRHDNLGDSRTYQPVVKTFDRRLPLSNQLIKFVSDYVIGIRYKIKAANQHDYLFVVHQTGPFLGQPLSLKGLAKIFQEIKNSSPNLLNHLTPHILRHTANDRFSELMDKRGANSAEEDKMRSYIMGWKEGSGTAATYTRRHIENKAREAALLLQERIKGNNNA
ncbi:TPA: tyrosine-type recombinase/integrase [Legionella pneumophila]|nr:tyrosine-type recombinase/integrase [Legionella pneumophila]